MYYKQDPWRLESILKNLYLPTVSFTPGFSLKMFVVHDGSEKKKEKVSNEKLGNLRHAKAWSQGRLMMEINTKLFSIWRNTPYDFHSELYGKWPS